MLCRINRTMLYSITQYTKGILNPTSEYEGYYFCQTRKNIKQWIKLKNTFLTTFK